MKKILRISVIILLFFLLILVRFYGVKIFYDPFIKYFNGDFLTGSFPELNAIKLFLNLVIRYVINSTISLAIIYFVFLKKEYLKFSVLFYLVAFIVFIIIYFVQLKLAFSNGYLLAFYIRRMLIHPIFLLILLPTFYYQKITKK